MRWLTTVAAALLLAAAASAEIPEGYYDPAQGLSGEELQQALHDIIDDHNAISYDDVWDAFYTTDDKPDGMVWDMYSDIPGGTPPYEYEFGDDQGGTASGEGEGYNREHSWPKSWYGGEVMPMYTDLFVVVPSDIYVNNRRNNYPYGEVDWPTWTSMNDSRLGPNCAAGYVGTVFEPRDEFKGDLARGYFYMATRYYGEDAGWPGSDMTDGAQLLPWALEMMLDWHGSDPVSDKELDRNEAVWDIQENRNPYIDHPEYVSLVFGPTGVGGAPAELLTPAVAPNPFRTSAEIAFSLSSAGTASIRVYGPDGRLASVPLESTELPAGQHSLTWDGRGSSGRPLPPGVYLVRLTCGGREASVPVLRLGGSL